MLAGLEILPDCGLSDGDHRTQTVVKISVNSGVASKPTGKQHNMLTLLSVLQHKTFPKLGSSNGETFFFGFCVSCKWFSDTR